MGRPTRGPARQLRRTRKASAAQCLLEFDQDVRCIRIRNRYWLFMGPKKAEHLRCILDEAISLVAELHFGQHIARKEFALGSVLLSVAHFHELLNGERLSLRRGDLNADAPPALGWSWRPCSRNSSRRE